MKSITNITSSNNRKKSKNKLINTIPVVKRKLSSKYMPKRPKLGKFGSEIQRIATSFGKSRIRGVKMYKTYRSKLSKEDKAIFARDLSKSYSLFKMACQKPKKRENKFGGAMLIPSLLGSIVVGALAANMSTKERRENLKKLGERTVTAINEKAGSIAQNLRKRELKLEIGRINVKIKAMKSAQEQINNLQAGISTKPCIANDCTKKTHKSSYPHGNEITKENYYIRLKLHGLCQDYQDKYSGLENEIELIIKSLENFATGDVNVQQQLTNAIDKNREFLISEISKIIEYTEKKLSEKINRFMILHSN